MSVSPTGNASSLAALYAALSASSTVPAPTDATSPTSTTTATTTAASGVTPATGSPTPSTGTLTPPSVLNQDIAAEQLSYLVSMQSTLQDDFLATGIVTPQEGALLFGDTTNPLGLVAPSSTSEGAVQPLIVTPGLSDLAIKVLTGQTSLESVVAAGTQAQQNAVTASQVAAAYGASGGNNDPNADSNPDTGDGSGS